MRVWQRQQWRHRHYAGRLLIGMVVLLFLLGCGGTPGTGAVALPPAQRQPLANKRHPNSITKIVMNHLQNGAIILMHAGSQVESETLDGLMTKLEQMGYQMITVTQVLQ